MHHLKWTPLNSITFFPLKSHLILSHALVLGLVVSRVLRDSTARFVGPSHFTFFGFLRSLASLHLPKCLSDNRVQKYIKSMIKLNPFVTRLILGWGISSDHQKNSQVKIWAATATYLRSKGYIRSKFQSGKFGNLIADSESLQKSVKRKCLSFFDIPTRTWCNLTSKVIIGLKLLFCLKFGFI